MVSIVFPCLRCHCCFPLFFRWYSTITTPYRHCKQKAKEYHNRRISSWSTLQSLRIATVDLSTFFYFPLNALRYGVYAFARLSGHMRNTSPDYARLVFLVPHTNLHRLRLANVAGIFSTFHLHEARTTFILKRNDGNGGQKMPSYPAKLDKID